MQGSMITAVGIDVSKGESMVAIRRPGGEIVKTPFKVKHNATELNNLICLLKDVGGDIRVIMEHTGSYWYPIARTLHEAGFYVSVVNAILIHHFSDNSLRKVKTDRADALKIANYGLTFWTSLQEYVPADEVRLLLKAQSRLYLRTTDASVVLRNGLISLLDQTFPGVNKLFASSYRNSAGHYKWVDFAKRFWHRSCVADLSLSGFSDVYEKWCKRTGYVFNEADVRRIHAHAQNAVATFPKSSSTRTVIVQSVNSLNAIYDTLQHIRNEMDALARKLPEYDTVMSMYGVGPITGAQLIAEIGDVRKFTSKAALVAYAGVDAPPYQSGSFDAKSRHISKRGSPHLRHVLFLVCCCIWQNGNSENSIYTFMQKKHDEGKHYYVCMVAGAAKFLRIYYAKVSETLNSPTGELVGTA